MPANVPRPTSENSVLTVVEILEGIPGAATAMMSDHIAVAIRRMLVRLRML